MWILIIMIVVSPWHGGTNTIESNYFKSREDCIKAKNVIAESWGTKGDNELSIKIPENYSISKKRSDIPKMRLICVGGAIQKEK